MPRPVALALYTPQWIDRAAALIADLQAAAPGVFLALHHVGSTAVPGLSAKPVIDLLGEVGSLAEIDAARSVLAGLGYRWRGENGVAGRRYFTRDDPATGARTAHLHVHAVGDPMIAWHRAFRDRLRAEPGTAAAYAREKARCAALHPDDSGACAACKRAWTDRVAAEAVAGVGRRGVRAGCVGCEESCAQRLKIGYLRNARYCRAYFSTSGHFARSERVTRRGAKRLARTRYT